MKAKVLTRTVAVAVALGFSLNTHATLRSWSGGANNNDVRWSTANNWIIGPPAAGDDLLFPSGASHPNNNNDFPAATTFNSLTIGGNNYTLSGSSIALNAGITVTNSGNLNTVNTPLLLNSNQSFMVAATSGGLSLLGPIDNSGKNLTVAVDSPAIAQVSVGLSGAGGLTKTGTGSLTISNHTYSGATIVSNGTLRVLGAQSSSAVTLYGGTFGGTGTVGPIAAAGAGAKTLDPGTSPGILNTGNLLLDANTTLLIQLNGATPGTGHDQLNVVGSVNLGGATLSLSLGFVPVGYTSFVIINNDGGDPVIGTFNGLAEGAITSVSGVQMQISYVGGDGNDVTLTTIGVARYWNGAGANGLWSNATNWVGGVAPNPGDDLIFPPGAARLINTNNFPTATIFNAIILSGGDYFLYGSNIVLHAGIIATNITAPDTLYLPFTLNADQTITADNGSMNLNLSGDINTSGKQLTFTGSGTVQLQSYISGSGGLTKTGVGLVSLYTSNTFSGSVLIQQGSLSVYQANALGSTAGSTSLSNGATLNLINVMTNPEPLVVAGKLNMLNGNKTLTGNITLFGTDSLFQVAAGVSITVNGVIDGAGRLYKILPGTLLLNATNTFTGGTLITNGIFGGSGRAGDITFQGNAGMTLTPGNSGPGILTCSNLTFSYLTTFALQLNGPTPGTSHDQVAVNGTVALNNAPLALTLGYTPALGDNFVILKNDGSNPVSGTFYNLSAGALLTNGASIFRISYTGGDGNDVTLTTTLGAPASTLTSINNQPGGFMQITGQGITNLAYIVQATTNLTAPVIWTNLGTATANGIGVYQFTDTNAPLLPHRFYRAVSP